MSRNNWNLTNGPIVFVVFSLLIAAVIAVTYINHGFAESAPGGGDFLARWLGLRVFMTEGISPYSDEATLAIQNMYYGRAAESGEDLVYFVYPLYSILFFGIPAAIEDYAWGRALWMTFLEISLVATVFLSLKLTGWKVSPIKLAVLLLFGVLWYAGMRNVINGQFAALNAVLIIWALIAVQEQEDITAGIFLALSTIKPQMVFLLIPFVLIWAISRQRYTIVLSFFGSLIALFFLTMVLIPTWPLQMFVQIMQYTSYTELGSLFTIIANSLPGISTLLSYTLHAIGIIYLLAEWGLALKKDERWFLWTALLTLVLTNFIAVRTATTHYTVLLPAMFLTFRVWEQRWKLNGAIATWSSLIVLFFGWWALFFATVEGNQEKAIMYLPVPFFCLIGLWWVRWWAMRPPRLMLEEFAERIG